MKLITINSFVLTTSANDKVCFVFFCFFFIFWLKSKDAMGHDEVRLTDGLIVCTEKRQCLAI